MPHASTAEIYFIALVMIFMTIFSVVSIYIFIRQYKKEKKETEARLRKKASEKDNTAQK